MAEESNANFSIFKIDGKPVEKLIETVSAGIGVLYKPRAMRKEADAKAYEVGVLAEANAKASIIVADAENEIAERARQRLYYQEMQRQVNLDNIIENSTKHLNETVSEQPVDEDWRTRFFNKAQDVTSEELQEIWGKILASEINKPGTISIRSLEILSSLSKSEAEILEKIGGISNGNGNIFKVKDLKLDNFDISYNDLLILRSAGLMYDSDNLILTFSARPELNQIKNNSIIVNIGGLPRLAYRADGNAIDHFENFVLTSSGIEIINVIGYRPNEDYYKILVEEYKKKGIIITNLIDFALDLLKNVQ